MANNLLAAPAATATPILLLPALPPLNDGSLYKGAQVQLDVEGFAREIDEITDPARVQWAHNAGLAHWALIAAGNEGRLEPRGRRTPGDFRWTHTAPFPLQSMDTRFRKYVRPATRGHVVVSADWHASHPQLLASLARDRELGDELGNGGLYAELRHMVSMEDAGGVDPAKAAKRIVLARLNGGGVATVRRNLPGASDELIAQVEAWAAGLFGGEAPRFPTAAATLSALRDVGVSLGAESRNLAAGIALMRYEAGALDAAAARVLAEIPGAVMMLPNRDELVFSVPEASASSAVSAVCLIMHQELRAAAGVLAGGPDPGVPAPGSGTLAELDTPYVSARASYSWGGESRWVEPSTLRGEALGWLGSSDKILAALGAAAVPDAASDARDIATGKDKTNRTIAITTANQARRWLAEVGYALAGAPLLNVGRSKDVRLTTLRVVREDKNVPAMWLNTRTQRIHVDADSDERLTDTLEISLYEEIATRYGLPAAEVAKAIHDACVSAAQTRKRDPVLDYFNALPAWDGVPRIDTWLTVACGVEDSPLHRAYAAKTLLSLVRRTRSPGAKVDTSLILVGPQGAGKSTAFRELAPCGSYGDVHVDPSEKDQVIEVNGYAIAEWGELAQLRNREAEQLKAYLSRAVDHVRVPYGKNGVDLPRMGIIVGTSNTDDILRDETGSRRFWTVRVGAKINTAWIAANRDQLWAEACAREATGEPHFLDDAYAQEKAYRDAAFAPDRTASAELTMFLAQHAESGFMLAKLLDHLKVADTDRHAKSRVMARSLREIGWDCRSERIHGVPQKVWRPGAAAAATLPLPPAPTAPAAGGGFSFSLNLT